ncbi:MAG: flagellin [Hyphomonadaceae bacterium]|nr:MAG: flagellin [Hyphomonadaceae bacterium]
MISGLNTAGLSLAMRTADRASKTMDKMATQIATGKKVVSVKDDGAAYVRDAAINSDKIRHQTVAEQMGRVNAIQDVSIASMDAFLNATIKGRELVIKAIDAIQNSASRAAIQAEHVQVALSMDTIAPNAVVDGISFLAAHIYSPTVTINFIGTSAPYVWGTQPFASDPEYDDAVLQLENLSR